MQFTAVSTTAENQALATSLYIHNIPNNNDNQDIVSMGTNAAVSCQKIINNTFEILSIELITITQTIHALDLQDKISASTKNLYDDIRKILPVVTKDIAPILL